MPNTSVPANATGLSTGNRFNRSAIMRAAVAYARELIEREREWYGNRYAAEIRYGGRRPTMKLPSWREAMSHGLKAAWAEARENRLSKIGESSIGAASSVELSILSIHAAERITRPERDMLAGLTARAAELRRATVAQAHR